MRRRVVVAAGHLDARDASRREMAPRPLDNQPTRTTVEVSRLPTPIAIELKVIATI